MSGVDVSALKAGQRVRVTYEGVLLPGGRDHLYVNGSVCVRSSIGQPAIALVAVEVLPDPIPTWVSEPGQIVCWGTSIMVRAEHRWVVSAGQGLSPDDFIWTAVQSGAAVRLVPEGTP